MRALPRIFILIVVLALLFAPSARSVSAADRSPADLPTPTPGDIPTAAAITSTPGADGSIVHIVGYGQTLITIAAAYGIDLAELRAQNNLTTNDTIFVGDKLIIRPPNTPTPVYTATLTPTPTHKPTSTRRPPTATHPPAATTTRTLMPTPSQPAPSLPMLSGPLTNKKIGAGLVVFCTAGLIIVGFALFKK
ncbi:MAG TPA: LysM peptidoglycan-binding domain-containing protein [Anaerolineaceae bacterium]|jgi:LysM repeat protein